MGKAVLGAIVVVVVGCGIWWLNAANQAQLVREPSVSTNARATREMSRSGIRSPVAPPSANAIQMGDALHVPRGPEDVAWLNRNGFLSQEAMDAANRMPPNRRLLNPNDGIEPSEVVIASNLALLDPDERDYAISFLEEAALQGSGLAFDELGAIFLHESIADPLRSEAYFRARALRGNWVESLRPRLSLPMEQSVQADLMAHQIIDNINSRRIRRGLAPLQRDPRPGLGDLLEAASRM